MGQLSLANSPPSVVAIEDDVEAEMEEQEGMHLYGPDDKKVDLHMVEAVEAPTDSTLREKELQKLLKAAKGKHAAAVQAATLADGCL